MSIFKNTLLVYQGKNNRLVMGNLTDWTNPSESRYGKMLKLNRMGANQPKAFCFSDKHLVMFTVKYLIVLTWIDQKWRNEKKYKLSQKIKRGNLRELIMLTSKTFILLTYDSQEKKNYSSRIIYH